MPIYEYACEECGNEFEVEQRITEDALKTHAGCGGAVKRLISRTAFTLKGSGWYSDHYGLKGKSDAKAGEAKAEGGKAEAGAKAEGKADAKSGGKSETQADAKKATPGPAKSDPKKSSGGGKAA